MPSYAWLEKSCFSARKNAERRLLEPGPAPISLAPQRGIAKHIIPRRRLFRFPIERRADLDSLSTNVEPGATCSLLRVETARRSVRIPIRQRGPNQLLNGDFDLNRTRIDSIRHARAWSGLGIFNHNLVKIP